MHNYKHVEDTICAVATPPGHGGISVVRISGPRACEYSGKLIGLPENLESHRSYLLNIYNIDKTKQLDEALVTYFAEGRSFTGDQTIEISCHGSPIVSEEIIQNLILAGCRLAEKGEFTFRSFMSGKIDLIQAESILSLIQSDTQKSKEVSLRQLKGELSQNILEMKNKITWLLAHLEASIDFSLEDLQTIDNKTVKENLTQVYKANKNLLESYKKGRVITDSLNVVLVGEPNVGKSSLFNRFIKSDKAIVTEIAGTTRDVLESYAIIAGLKVKFIDTAGLHETTDVVEKIGIQKTKEQLKDADYIFYVVDGTQNNSPDYDLIETHKEKLVLLINKSDLSEFNQNFTHEIGKKINNKIFEVSAKKTESINEILNFLEGELKQAFHESAAVVLKTRQFELLEKMNHCLLRAIDLSTDNLSGEFIAFELRDALECCFNLLGERLDDQVMAKVFQEFCIGK